MIIRQLQQHIQDSLFKNKIIILYGTRRVGKTTLVKEIMKPYGLKALYINCESSFDRAGLGNHQSSRSIQLYWRL